MANLPTTTDVEAWLRADKVVIEDLDWKTLKGEAIEKAAKVLARGLTEREKTVQDGELVLVHHLRTPRHWAFKLIWNGTEVYRWDFKPLSEPVRHTNPVRRPPGFPRRVTDRVHEHIFSPDHEMSLAKALPGEDHGHFQDALDAFLARCTLSLGGALEEPPSVQEGLL